MTEKNFQYSQYPNTIVCCAWCFPARTIFAHRPELDGSETISHGMCPAHLEQFLQDIKKSGGNGAAALG